MFVGCVHAATVWTIASTDPLAQTVQGKVQGSGRPAPCWGAVLNMEVRSAAHKASQD